jgi:hypothetical protein
MKVWEIECDALDKRLKVKAGSHPEMVEILLKRGFKRLLKDDVPYQDEPLVYEDAKGNTWDAMPVAPESIMNACGLPHMDSIYTR